MYEKIKFILFGLVALIGIFMAACPQYSVKKEERENKDSLAATRKKGILLVIVAIVCGIVVCQL